MKGKRLWELSSKYQPLSSISLEECGVFISLGIVIDALGFIGGAIAFFFAPVALAFAPWYAAIADNNWFPVGLVYGGGLVASILYVIGSAIDGD